MYFKHRYTNIFYEKIGEKKQVILILPGWGDTRKTFNMMINHLKENFTIYIIDYPGFGNSPAIHKELTIYNYAEIIKDFLGENNIKNPIIISHSFGGRITSILQGKLKIPIKQLILIDVAGIKRKSIKKAVKTILYKVTRNILHLLHLYKLEEKLRERFSSTDYKSIPNFMKKTFQNIVKEDLKKYYKKITSETLIIWGAKDTDTPLKDAYTLKRMIKNSGLIIYKNAHHFSYLEYPYNTNLIIDSFIKKEDI